MGATNVITGTLRGESLCRCTQHQVEMKSSHQRSRNCTFSKKLTEAWGRSCPGDLHTATLQSWASGLQAVRKNSPKLLLYYCGTWAEWCPTPRWGWTRENGTLNQTLQYGHFIEFHRKKPEDPALPSPAQEKPCQLATERSQSSLQRLPEPHQGLALFRGFGKMQRHWIQAALTGWCHSPIPSTVASWHTL